MSFPSYPTYKPSGVDWIGVIPTHWDVGPFKWQIERNDGGVWGDDPDGEQDTIVLRSTEQTVDGHWRMEDPASRKLSESERAAALLSEGDLVVTKSSGSSLHIGKTTIVSKEIANLGCCYSNFMQRVRTKPGFMPKLAWYLMNNDITRLQFDLLSNSTTGLANLNGTMIGQVLVAVPPADEQTSITAFLDRESAKIDALVEEQKRLIELLKEKRQAVISQAVTKGLDPNVPMKDSGVEWLGKVPAHWEVLPCRAIVFEKTARNDGAICGDYLSLMANVGVIPYAEKGDVGNKAPEDLSKCKLVAAGDIVINSMNYGIGSFGLSDLNGVCSPVYVVLRPINEVMETRFALRIFAHRAFQTYAQSFGNGILAHRAAIGWDTLKSIGVPVPPLDEQRLILAHVDASTARFEALIVEAEAGVELLMERRSALISAAVTGKIDVRGLAQQPEGAAA